MDGWMDGGEVVVVVADELSWGVFAARRGKHKI